LEENYPVSFEELARRGDTKPSPISGSRDDHRKGAAGADLAFHPDMPTMLLDNPVAYR
jgi:hypothetical protein